MTSQWFLRRARMFRFWLVVPAFALSVACGDETKPGTDPARPTDAGRSGGADGGTRTGGTGGSSSGGTGGSVAGGTGGSTAGGTGGSGTGGSGTGGGSAGAGGGGETGGASGTAGSGGADAGGTETGDASTGGTGAAGAGGTGGAGTSTGGAGGSSTGGAGGAGTGGAGTGGRGGAGGSGTGGRVGTGGAGGAGTGGRGGMGGVGDGGAPEAPMAVVTEPEAAGLLVELNTGEIASGELAYGRGLRANVRTFGARMAREHAAANDELARLFRRIDVTPADSAKRRALAADHHAALQGLWQLSGAAFDLAYATSQVKAHTQALETLDGVLIPSARTAAFRTALVDWRVEVADHLADARSLLASLTPATTDAGADAASGN